MSADPTTSKSVVIADDSASVRDRFSLAVEQAGHRAIVVRSAAELLGARARRPRSPRPAGRRSPAAALLRCRADPHRSASSRKAVCRSWCSAARCRAPKRCASWRRSVSPATSTNTARCSTSCRRWRRTCSPTTSTGATARAWCSASRSPTTSASTIAAALSLNLSQSGIAIRTTSPLERDGQVRLRFSLPGAKHDFEVDAHVRWSDPRAGMGLQFDRVDAADQRRSTSSSPPTSSSRAAETTCRRHPSPNRSRANARA